MIKLLLLFASTMLVSCTSLQFANREHITKHPEPVCVKKVKTHKVSFGITLYASKMKDTKLFVKI